MSTPDFIILVLAAIAGIAAAAGGIVITFKTPRYAAARVAFCIAALCVFLVGVIWGVTAEHSSMAARYAGAGITGAIAAVGLVWILTHLQGEKEAPEATAFLECNFGMMPKTFPASGRIWYADILPQAHGEGPLLLSLGYMFGPPNTPFESGVKLDIAYECRISNYGTEPLFNVVIYPVARFIEVIKNSEGNGATSGATISIKKGSISIPKVEIGNPFIFYVKSQNPHFVEITFEPEMAFERHGVESKSRLSFSKGMQIHLNPFDGFKSPPAPPPPAPSSPDTQEKSSGKRPAL
jgi:hypothetical protein